jgi:hypothetical protein
LNDDVTIAIKPNLPKLCFFWTERELDNFPNERRALGSWGPFDLPAKGKVQIDVAFPWARDYNGTAWESAVLLRERASYIKELFQTDSALIYGIEKPSLIHVRLVIQPNPTSGRIRISNLPDKNKVHFSVINIFGEMKIENEKPVFDGSLEIDLSVLPSGQYIIKIITENQIITGSVIKI